MSYYASDYSPRVLVLDDGLLKVTLSRSHKILEIVCPPFVFNDTSPDNPLFYPVNHVLRILVRRWLARPLVDQVPFRKGPRARRPVVLGAGLEPVQGRCGASTLRSMIC